MKREAQTSAAVLQRAAAGQANRFAVALGALYAALGIAWIMLSDHAVGLFASDPAALESAQRLKGIAYVAVTALLLALLVRHGYLRLLRARADAESRELQVRDLFERHPQPMWVHDAETGRVLTVNRAACRRYARTEAEFVGTPVDAFVRPDDAAAAAGAVCHESDGGERFYVKLRTHDLPFHGRAAVLVMVDEVTRQVLAERRLRRQERRMDQLHQSLGEVLWLASLDGREVHYVSPAFEAIYGRPASGLLADSSLWLSCVHPEDRAQAEASMHALLAIGCSSCEYRIVRPDGATRWIADRKRLILDDDGQTALIGGIGEDITAAKERDAALATTNAELERRVALRTAELARVNLELQHMNEELDAFARTAAHDLKSPLAGIAGFAALLRVRHAGALSEDGLRMLGHVERSARQMADLVGDLLALSRSSRGRFEPCDVDLAALGRELVDELRAQQPARQVVFAAPPELWVHADPGLARSLLANLLGNAWKFSARRELATIRLSGQAEGSVVRVAVEDDGVGFDMKQAGRLFEPFQRLHSGGEFTGTGVGLATCRRIVERHGGEIAAASEPGRGAAFRFTLPVPVGARARGLTHVAGPADAR